MSARAATYYGFSAEEREESVPKWQVSARERVTQDSGKWFNRLLDELTMLSQLSDNWDSYEARAIDPESAAMTAKFLCSVLKGDATLPKLVPTVRGNIQLEWSSDRAELEIEVGAHGPLTAHFVDNQSHEEWENAMTADLANIAEKINACF